MTLGQTGLEPTHQEIARTAIGIALSPHRSRRHRNVSLRHEMGRGPGRQPARGKGTPQPGDHGDRDGPVAWSTSPWPGPDGPWESSPEKAPAWRALRRPLVIGVSVFTVATIMWDRASLTTRNLGIHTMPYAIPILRPVYIQPRG